MNANCDIYLCNEEAIHIVDMLEPCSHPEHKVHLCSKHWLQLDIRVRLNK